MIKPRKNREKVTSRTARESGSINILPHLPSRDALHSAVQLDPQSPPTAGDSLSSDKGVSLPVVSPLEPPNLSPESSCEAPNPVPPPRTPSAPEHSQIEDAPGRYSPVPSPPHSPLSLAPSNAPSETNSFHSADLLESYRAPAAQSVSSVASSDISDSELSNRYAPSRADVVAARSILFSHFPMELVEIILDAAQYYPHSFFAMPTHHFNHPLAARDGRLQAMLTAPIVDSEFISRVVIRTESHDQGWSSYPQDQGTFNNSWTWLDLALVRKPSESTPEAPPDWRIYTNLHASRSWQSKEVILDTSNEIIGALRPGDSLAIWAEARSVLGNQSVGDSVTPINHPGIPDG
jgi:hypothetical protein